MPQTHKYSFLITLGFLFLLPIFFIPGGALGIGVAKSALLVLGVVAIVLAFLYEIWREGKIEFPWHPFIFSIVALPLVYLLSAFLATPSSLSLFGYYFEVGTFGFMLLGTLLLLLIVMIISDTRRALQALGIFFLSVSLVVLFAIIKIVFGLSTSLEASGDVLAMGNFFGNMGNPIGNWTDLAIAFGLLAAFTAFLIGIVPLKRSRLILAYVVFVLATALTVLVSFSTAFIITLGSSVLLFLYFWKVETHFLNSNFFLRPTFLPIILGAISLICLVNPTISTTQGKLNDVIARTFKIENSDVRPSFSATLGISKEVLSKGGLLGSGPNTFGRDWLIYKPINVNTTPFWAVAFPFGAGFIPTQIASTGMLGTALWLVFFILLIALGVKTLNNIPESRLLRFTIISTLLATLFLWVSSFLYVPSATMLLFTFIFTGLFIASLRESGIISSRSVDFRESPQMRFFSIVLLVVIAISTLGLGWVGLDKTASAFYFKKAVDLSNTPGVSLDMVEKELNEAVKFAEIDTYYVALSRINFAKAQAATSATFEENLRKSIEAARNAVSTNPAGYENWVSLGMIYSALVPAPLSVEGAYENALLAYSEANKRNPNNPELMLLLAQLELGKGNVEAARSYIRNSIALKEDYADAYLALARLEIQEGDTASAIKSAEKLALLMPNNPGVYLELGLLKFSLKDYTGAAAIFAQAISLAPDYANAKYYLGLSLANLGRKTEARAQFEGLLITNPDSGELKQALKNL